MKLGNKLTAVIVIIFVINVAVTVLSTMPGANPVKSVIIILCTHIATLIAMAVCLRIMVTDPLKKLISSIKGYRSGAVFGKSTRSDEIGELYNSFHELTDKIEAEREAQNRIIASISHDIKTPLTSVMGYAEFLQNPNLSEQRRKKYINTIYTKAVDIQQTVTGFDDYLSQNLDTSLKREFVTVGELMAQAEEYLKTDMINASFTLVCSCDNCSDKIVYADKTRIHRVLTNVLANAVRHGGKPGLEISFTAEPAGDDVLFTVKDNGVGVMADQLEKIFEPLYTTDSSRSVAGLGLSICREIIEAHGGAIHAESEYGKYFAVCFTLKSVSE